MKIEDTIDEFKDRRGYYLDDKYRLECYDTAISALEKQIPREPILLKSMVVKRCPVCKCVAESDCEEYGYCQYCGQALKWGVQKNE